MSDVEKLFIHPGDIDPREPFFCRQRDGFLFVDETHGAAHPCKCLAEVQGGQLCVPFDEIEERRPFFQCVPYRHCRDIGLPNRINLFIRSNGVGGYLDHGFDRVINNRQTHHGVEESIHGEHAGSVDERVEHGIEDVPVGMRRRQFQPQRVSELPVEILLIDFGVVKP